MAAKAPKPWKLTEDESFASFTAWQHNIIYNLSRDDNFKMFLKPEATWLRSSVSAPLRGFTNDSDDVITAQEKVQHLQQMLGLITQWVPHYLATDIVNNSTSMNSVWQFIRKYYGFQQSEVQLMKFSSISWEDGERPERLYQRILAHLQDNLLCSGSRLKHNGSTPDQNEDMSPMVERLAVLRWMELLHPSLPTLVQRTFARDLQQMTLKDLQPQIVDALDGFMEELRQDDIRSARVFAPAQARHRSKPGQRLLHDTQFYQDDPSQIHQKLQRAGSSRESRRVHSDNHAPSSERSSLYCRVCKAEGRRYIGHNFFTCDYISRAEKRNVVNTQQVEVDDDNARDTCPDLSSAAEQDGLEHIGKLSIVQSPTIHAFYNHHPLTIVCDSGASASIVHHSVIVQCQIPMRPTSHKAKQADGVSKLKPMGEVSFTVTRGPITLFIEALVVAELECQILAGMPFCKANEVVIDVPNDVLIIQGQHRIYYKNSETIKRHDPTESKSFLLRAAQSSVVWPGDYIELKVPEEVNEGEILAVEPRMDSHLSVWLQPLVTSAVGGVIRVPNISNSPAEVKRNLHIAQIHSTSSSSIADPNYTSVTNVRSTTTSKSSLFSEKVVINPDGVLSLSECKAFNELHAMYNNVFNPRIGVYNDASGKVRAHINMGPVNPPVNKGHLPKYSKDKMVMLQEKMDELEDLGVLARPEDLNVSVEYVSPSFLVKKSNGDHRLVTAFNSIAAYTKPIPSKSTSTDDVLRFLAGYRYLIKTDMTKQFFQLPMTKSSLKYLGTMTPYKGIRVYTRAAMGMPGSSEHLDELTSRIFGDMVQSGRIIRIADDLYVGADSIKNLLTTWEELLQRMERNNLRLSASKTVVCPVSTSILGWHWSQGTITPLPHKISPLINTDMPKTVKALRSWCGAFKFLKACIPNYSIVLGDLEAATAGKDSKENIHWTDELSDSFNNAKRALENAKTITIPRSSDSLVIATDGCIHPGGIGAVLFVTRNGSSHIGGYFSARLRGSQRKWLPCEVEALAIAAALNHWASYLLNSNTTTQILTDSRPCVQAYSRLQKGQFSASARISSFLSTLSRYNITLQHISGSNNLPADFCSRNPVECNSNTCQVCKFVKDCEDMSVRSVNIQDVENGRAPMPFLTLATWKATQQDCPHLRRAYSHLVQGTRPARKESNLKEVKTYLRSCTIGRDGVLVVRKQTPFARARDLIVVPQHILYGLLTALHLRLSHPTRLQLSKLFHRYYFALGSDTAIDTITSQCDQCAALAKMPKEIQEFTTSEPSTSPGLRFAADIMCRARQKILIVRECFSQFTITRLVPDERSSTLRDALLECTAELRSPSGCVIRVDGATGFTSLQNDVFLLKYAISIEEGRTKNVNKNPIAEKAVQEVELELKRCFPEGGPITPSQLALCTATLNSRIRNRGLSAREILFQRDHQTGAQLNFTDEELAQCQLRNRLANHESSAQSQIPKGKHAVHADVNIGDLIYIKADGDKHSARDKYIVVQTEWDHIMARKLKGSQFRSKMYKLLYSEVYKVPIPDRNTQVAHHPNIKIDPYASDDLDEDTDTPAVPPKKVPDDLNHARLGLQENVQRPNADDNTPVTDPVPETANALRRSERVRKRPAYLNDYVT